MSIIETTFRKIEAQQVGREGSDIYMVGQQLKDICKDDAHCAELVAADLENPQMGLATAAKQIKAWADKQKRVNNCVCVPPDVAEGIIRKFYGLPEAGKQEQETKGAGGMLDLKAFL